MVLDLSGRVEIDCIVALKVKSAAVHQGKFYTGYHTLSALNDLTKAIYIIVSLMVIVTNSDRQITCW